MPISDLGSINLVCVERGTSLQYAAQLMKKSHVGGVVVLEANGKGRAVGILTDRDIVLSLVAENLPLSTRVEDVMSKNVVCVRQNEGIASVVEQMEKEGVRRIIITDDNDRAISLVSSDDILQLVAKEMYGLGRLVDRQIQKEKLVRPNNNQLMI